MLYAPLVRRNRTNDRRRAIMRASSSPLLSHSNPVLLLLPLSPHTCACLMKMRHRRQKFFVRRSIIVDVIMGHHRCHLLSPMSSLSRWSAPLLWSTIQIHPVRFGPCRSDSLSLDDARRAKPACSSRLHAAELKASRPSSFARVLQLMLPTRCGRGHDRSVVLIGIGEKRG